MLRNLFRRFFGSFAFLWIWLRSLLPGRRPRRVEGAVRILAQEWVPLAETASYSFHAVDEDLPVPTPGSFRYEAQDALWLSGMEAEARELGRLGYGKALFAHGTFVGHDPVSMTAALKVLFPTLPQGVEASLQGLMKRQCNTLLRDVGNFLPDYATLFAAATSWGECTRNFVWSSGNHHAARLFAALELGLELRRLMDAGDCRKGILVVGHSHAGQVFALLTRLVAEAGGGEAPILREAIGGTRLEPFFHREALEELGGARLQFVTLGSPPRYRWFLGEGMGLVSVVNHRGIVPEAGSPQGLLHTRDGDYIQQWGIDGTDFFAPSSWERRLNARLDELLGPGIGVAAWRNAAKARKRVPEAGHTLLVDFKDASKFLPNCVLTIFGHGAYTRLSNMLPIMRMVREHLSGR